MKLNHFQIIRLIIFNEKYSWCDGMPELSTIKTVDEEGVKVKINLSTIHRLKTEFTLSIRNSKCFKSRNKTAKSLN